MKSIKVEMCDGKQAIVFVERILYLSDVGDRSIINFSEDAAIGVYMGLDELKTLIDNC